MRIGRSFSVGFLDEYCLRFNFLKHFPEYPYKCRMTTKTTIRTIRNIYPVVAIFLLILLNSFNVRSSPNSTRFAGEIFTYDGSKELSIRQIIFSEQYSLNNSTILNLGVSNEWHFVKFKLTKEFSEGDFFLMIDNPTIDSIQLFQIQPTLRYLGMNGSSIKRSESNRKTQNFMFSLGSHLDTSCEFVIRLKSGKQLLIPLRIDNKEELIADSNASENLLFIYFGIMMVLVIYNLFIFISIRESDYGFYVFYLITVALTQASLFGFGDLWFWPDSGWLCSHAVYLTGSLSGIGTILFAQQFLKTKTYTPVIHKILVVYIGLGFLSMLLCAFGLYNLSYNLLNFNAASALILLVASILSYKRGNRSGKFFILAWTIFLCGVTVFALKDFGILPYNRLTLYALPFGSAIEGILLSFGLADRINILKKEKETAQLRELEALKINEQELEQKVHDRTLQLEEAKNEVQKNYDYLRITQRQLVESEKLSGLGQMTAGIAHELNNPINFVSSNIAPLNRDVDQVLLFMHEFEKLPADASKDEITELKAKYLAADMPYVKSEIDMLMKGIHEGARRTAEIVKGLRIFARADRDTLVKANINECMEATLVVMKSSFKEEVTLTVDLDPNLPELDCYPGKLNQVFVNIIGNAVHATRMDGRDKKDRQIAVKTWADENHLFVSVKDNGKGMDEETKERIFEPFYTTKGVGEGTGLGLSITLGILEEHKGNVHVNTEQNKGTEFLIEIPRNLSQLRAMAA